VSGGKTRFIGVILVQHSVLVNLNADERICVTSGRMFIVVCNLGQNGSVTTRKSGIPEENGYRTFEAETYARWA